MLQDQPELDNVKGKGVFSGIVWGQVSRSGEIGLAFLFSILLVRLLGKADYGFYATILTITNFGVILTGFGFSETLNRYLPHAQSSRPPYQYGLLRQFFIFRLTANLLTGAVLWLSSAWLATRLQNPVIESSGWLLLLLLTGFSLSDLLTNYFIAFFELKRIFLIRSVTQIIGILANLLWFWLAEPTAIIPLTVLVFSLLLQILLYLRYLPLRSLFKVNRPPENIRPEILRYTRDLWFINLLTFALAGQFDILALAFLLKDPSQVAYYALISLTLVRVQTLVTGWSISNTSVFTTVYITSGEKELQRYLSYYYKLNLLAVLPVMGLLAAVAGSIIPLLFGVEFEPAARLLQVFIFFIFISVLLGAGLTHNVSLTLNRQRRLLRCRIYFSLANIVLDILLIPWLGALGAVISSGLASTSLHLVELWMVRDITGQLPWLFNFKMLGTLGLAVGGGWLCARWVDSYFWGSAAGGLTFMLIFLSMLLLLKPLQASDLALTRRLLPKLAGNLQYFSKG